MVTMGKYVIIFTAKRIICVEEMQSAKRNIEQQNLMVILNNQSTYKHWNIYFDDILKVKLCMSQQVGSDPATGDPILHSISSETNLFSSEESIRNNKASIIFNLKLFFTETMGEEDSFSDFRLSSKDISCYWRDIP